jgi:hypothetical protein
VFPAKISSCSLVSYEILGFVPCVPLQKMPCPLETPSRHKQREEYKIFKTIFLLRKYKLVNKTLACITSLKKYYKITFIVKTALN